MSGWDKYSHVARDNGKTEKDEDKKKLGGTNVDKIEGGEKWTALLFGWR